MTIPLKSDAAATWPGVVVDEPRFAAFLAERPTAAPEHAADLYLACACADAAAGALAAFERVYLSRVDGFVARHRLLPSTLEDLKQQLRERLFANGRIRDYSGQGPLGNWLRVLAVRAVVDLGRKKKETLLGAQSGSGLAGALRAPGEPELDFVKETYRAAVARAFKQSLGDLPSEQRNLLSLHFVDGLTLDELAGLFHIHRATVARRIASARVAVLDEARRRFCAEAGVAPAEADSVFALVRSQLDLTLSSALGRQEDRG